MTASLVALIPIMAFAGTGDVAGDASTGPLMRHGPQTATSALAAADLGRSLALTRIALTHDEAPSMAAPVIADRAAKAVSVRRAVAPAPYRLSSPVGTLDDGAYGWVQDELLLTAAQEAPPAAGAVPPTLPTADPAADADAIDADEALIDDRRRPGIEKKLPDRVTQDNPGAVRAPAPEAFPTDEFPVPDRWRIVTSLCPTKNGDKSIYSLYPNLSNVCRSKLDPYHQNILKGDRPLPEGKRPGFLKEDDWFFVANVISDTVVEPRSFPTPVGVQTTSRPDSLDVFGRADSLVLAQTIIAGVALIKGETTYKPPAIEYRLTLAAQVNHVDVNERRILFVEPSRPTQRTDHFVGIQEAFIDYHLGAYDTSRYDFISLRAGIQPMQADFRGFLFQDNQLGIRLFGNRDNNRFQFNIGAFWRLEKDTNSGLNSVVDSPRDDWVFFANAYRQDFPVVGLTSQVSVTYNMNREGGRELKIDDNGFPVRPALLGDLRSREYDVVYLGYAVDGRIGRINLTGQLYGAFGEDRNSFFTSRKADIRSYFGAAEVSYDYDWARFRLQGLFASGDGDPYNDTEAGFDAIFENPIFAGADTSYWIRQVIPFAGGGRAVGVNTRNGILNNLRSSKEQGQSNFNNPGTVLLGAGADFDLSSTTRLSANLNHLWFHKTDTIEALRQEGTVPSSIGTDVSAALIWRPNANQNLVFRLSGAVFDPSKGFRDLFTQSGKSDLFYSVLFNAILAY
ncbi:hypothetical protein [Blastomonas fulva]|uniref:hypothetical protein n=1 Tax=Blastomonas fulva TaxID=1550728 RepID=UPI0025A3417E|nr:hypothetical protein [Blastomonas fulva]MDM7930080.1 hypothetical protein [Blastomonas fulva]MDM7967443.1 hypothetical protein [Blastomonas fulva]